MNGRKAATTRHFISRRTLALAVVPAYLILNHFAAAAVPISTAVEQTEQTPAVRLVGGPWSHDTTECRWTRTYMPDSIRGLRAPKTGVA